MNAANAILIVASDFPPLAGTNTQRVQALVKYLPEYGWSPTVVTRAVEDLPLIDSGELQAPPPGVRLIRVLNPDPFARLRRARGRAPGDIAAGAAAPTARAAAAAPAQAARLRALAAAVTVPLHAVLRWTAYVPDATRPWAAAAAAAAASVAAHGGIDVVLTSGPSYATHLAGLALKRRTGLPWIADFRDLWVGRPGRRPLSRWHAFMDRRYEREVVERSDHIVVASPAWVDIFRRRYGAAVEDRMSCITNGYDGDKLRGIAPAPRGRGTLFVHTGSMYGSESPAPFLQALGNVHRRRPELTAEVEVRLIGYAGDDLPLLRDIAAAAGIEDRVAFTGPQPHERCLAEQAAADVLLLFHAPVHKVTLSGKSFEYMATGKPVLALIPPDGIQAELLRRAGTATIVQHGDIAATEAALEAMLSGRMPQPRPDWDYIRRYERRALTGRLAAIAAGLAAVRTATPAEPPARW